MATSKVNKMPFGVISQHKTLLLGELDGGGLSDGGDAVAAGLDRDEIAATHAGLRLNPVRAGHSPVQAAIIDGQTREHRALGISRQGVSSFGPTSTVNLSACAVVATAISF